MDGEIREIQGDSRFARGMMLLSARMNGPPLSLVSNGMFRSLGRPFWRALLRLPWIDAPPYRGTPRPLAVVGPYALPSLSLCDAWTPRCDVC
ncbi:hypothetical protein CEXT_703561 [Caerostris extrusa]|uniref:Uncharacterized protein n=1 Tax=Caerostris extrusa TaxID=172846 RepID=A0AAV4MXM1_CAEEX|nr:hypothetical protein CEXT_703561 [Caerostris extrusa]